MPSAAKDVDEIVEPCAVRHRRRVEDRVFLADVVDIDEIAEAGGGEIARGQHDPLGAPGGAGCVEQPDNGIILQQDRRGHRLAPAHGVECRAFNGEPAAHAIRRHVEQWSAYVIGVEQH